MRAFIRLGAGTASPRSSVAIGFAGLVETLPDDETSADRFRHPEVDLKHATLTIAMVCSLAAPPPAFAWGEQGHSIVAELAQRRLGTEARRAVETILGPGVSLASVSSWADDWRADGHPETTRWHFVDVDVANPAYDAARDCKAVEGKGDCIVAELRRATEVLSAPGLAARDKRTALMLVVHLVGDLTQPLHCSERAGDAGGNGVRVSFEGRKEHRTSTTLHAVWDEALIADRVYDWGAFVTDLEANVMPALDATNVESGSLEEWVNDCHKAGIDAYRLLPQAAEQPGGSPAPLALGKDYGDATYEMLRTQLAKGGLRLARTLNDAFAKAAADGRKD